MLATFWTILLRPWALKKIELSRRQIEQIAIYVALNQNVQSVTIEQTSDSGIGLNHHAIFHSDSWHKDFSVDITDVSNW
jgi:hypothetical protein